MRKWDTESIGQLAHFFFTRGTLILLQDSVEQARKLFSCKPASTIISKNRPTKMTTVTGEVRIKRHRRRQDAYNDEADSERVEDSDAGGSACDQMGSRVRDSMGTSGKPMRDNA